MSKLFEIGPMAYTPGTKMPEQTIGSAEDREALVKFLEKATNEIVALARRALALALCRSRSRR